MKRPILITLIIIFSFFMLAGCKKMPASFLKKAFVAKEEKPASPQVESVDLAEAIMNPEPVVLNILRDPFRPITRAAFAGADIKDIEPSNDLKLKGTVLADKSYFALIESPLKSKVYKEKDSVGEYIVQRIDARSVVLKKGDLEVILKTKGDEKK